MAATGKSYFARGSYRFLPGEHEAPAMVSDHPVFELDESDIWSSTARSASPDFLLPTPRTGRNGSAAKRSEAAGASSLPVNVPDWSKILKDDYRENRGGRRIEDEVEYNYADEEEEEEEQEDYSSSSVDGANRTRIPPHEFLARQFARTRIASFSVHEGVGRTLKGRDLSRVRNAIWEKTGFQD